MKQNAFSKLPSPPDKDKYTGCALEARGATDGEETILAGINHYQKALAHALKKATEDNLVWGILRPEPENQHDPNAIAVYAEWKQVGYLKAHDALDAKDLHLLQASRKTQVVVPLEVFTFKDGKLGAKLYWSTMDTPTLTEGEIQQAGKAASSKGCGCLSIIALIFLVWFGIAMCVT